VTKPLERATKYLWGDPYSSSDAISGVAKGVLNAALDRDEIAEALFRNANNGIEDYDYRETADAVIEHLLGASNV